MAWRQLFQSIGWWRSPTEKQYLLDSSEHRSKREGILRELLAEEGVPDHADDDFEPWIFCVPLTNLLSWQIRYFGFTTHIIGGEEGLTSHKGNLWIIATRVRLVAAETMDHWVRSWMYSDLVGCRVEVGKDWAGDYAQYWLRHRAGGEVNITVKTVGPRLIDRAVLLGQMVPQNYSDSEFLIGASNMQTAKSNIRSAQTSQSDFVSTVGEFWAEATMVSI